MSYLQIMVVHGVRCDYRGCDAILTGVEEDRLTGMRVYDEECVGEGWTIWQTRGREHRCPDHPVKVEAKARLIAGHPRRRGTVDWTQGVES